jgi:hypothetical protein
MPSYWWKCQKCGCTKTFEECTESRGIVHFILDELIPGKWNQSVLVRWCPQCENESMRITYEFPGNDRIELCVVHIVGLEPRDAEGYVPMMWETQPQPSETTWFDFKYFKGRKIFGLNRPAVVTRTDLIELFSFYRKLTGQLDFP